ncbi:hypothetical protein [Cetobacterium sp.]|uniref:hypothetical protein n=1 Tax=Cetobacterium sp. TaxID=2071632 RepID=UPI003AF03762
MLKNAFIEDAYKDVLGEELDKENPNEEEEFDKENTLEDDYDENEEWENEFNNFFEDDEQDFEELKDAEKGFRHTHIPDPDFNF